ncbi:TfoX/Sxy family protein [Arenimonas sp.]|uniref:TfoX/Sxy family protein n=1 Tax=Arenimonas sp. TaxID=1872635 RepID=UPI0039E58868
MTAKLRNIGPKSMAWLRQTGIRTLEDLQGVGALAAYVRIKRAGFKPSLNLLYALEGALLDCHWQEIPEARRNELVVAADAAVALLPKGRGKAMPAAAPVTTRQGEGEEASMPEPDFGFDDPDRQEEHAAD